MTSFPHNLLAFNIFYRTQQTKRAPLNVSLFFSSAAFNYSQFHLITRLCVTRKSSQKRKNAETQRREEKNFINLHSSRPDGGRGESLPSRTSLSSSYRKTLQFFTKNISPRFVISFAIQRKARVSKLFNKFEPAIVSSPLPSIPCRAPRSEIKKPK